MLAFSTVFLLPSIFTFANPFLDNHKRDSESASLISLSISSRARKGNVNIADADRNHVCCLIERAASRPCSDQIIVNTTNELAAFTVFVDVGSPATRFELLMDTGSSNTWVGAGTPYVPTSTSFNTTRSVNVKYGSGFMNGTEFFDILNLAPNVKFNQSIGVATSFSGFAGVDGIIGFGPPDLTNGTVEGITGNIPTVVDSLHSQGLIKDKVIGIFFKPTLGGDDPLQTGSLDLGGVDQSKIVGSIDYVPITSTSPTNRFWGIDLSVTLGNKQILPLGAGVVDTGTTLLLLHSEGFNAYVEAVGASLDNTTGFLTISEEKFLEIPSLFLNVGGRKLEFTRDAQAWPQGTNELIGGDPNKIYLAIGDLQALSNLQSVIIGQVVLQRYYSIYDSDKQRVGLAATAHTFDTTNVQNITTTRTGRSQ